MLNTQRKSPIKQIAMQVDVVVTFWATSQENLPLGILKFKELIDWLLSVLRRFQHFSVMSRRFLGKLPVVLVHLFWHLPVSRNAQREALSAKLLPFLRYLVWPGRGSNPRPPGCSCTTPQRRWNWIEVRYIYIYFYSFVLTLFLIRQFCSRRLWTYFFKKWKFSIIKWITYD